MRFSLPKKLSMLTASILTMGFASIINAETLRVGMECTYAPFNYKTADGELITITFGLSKTF